MNEPMVFRPKRRDVVPALWARRGQRVETLRDRSAAGGPASYVRFPDGFELWVPNDQLMSETSAEVFDLLTSFGPPPGMKR